MAVAIGVAAAAAGGCAGIDVWLSSRAAAGTDTAQQLAPLFSYIGVGRAYVLARALGLTALLCSALAVAAGLLATRRPSPLRRTHRALSLVTIVLVAAHATTPYAGVFPPFGGWATATVPFAQPYSWGTTATWAESIGIIALYVMVLMGPTYYLAGRWRHGWVVAHRLALGTYVLAVVHTLVLGSDFLVRGSLRVTLIGAQVPLLVLLARRVPHRASAAVWLLALVVAGLAVAGAAGAPLGGFALHGA
ncbi:MAG: hypothetical protein ACRDTP_02985 [Mycobacteriales bacterium]